jgi:O-antigen/teichoic acid export membrane protein
MKRWWSQITNPDEGSLAINTIAQSSPLMIGYLASFLSAPIVLGGLGLRAFGIWALTGALAQYANLLDLGVGQVLVRFVALHDAEGSREAIGEVLAVGLCTITTIAVVLTGASWGAAGLLAHQLGGITTGQMRVLLLCSSTMLCCSMLVNVMTAYPIGLRRMVVPNIAKSGGALINFVFSVGAIAIKPQLVFYAEANAAASLATVLVVACVVVATRPSMPLRIPRIARVRDLLRFSVQNQVLALASLINFQSDKVVIALFVGPSAAGAYELSNRVAAAARQVGVYTASAMIPTLTAQRAKSSRDSLVAVYERLTRQSSALAFPFLVLTAAIAPLILRAWLGKAPPYSAIILIALSLAYIVNTTTGVGNALAYADGKPGISARAATATAIANIVLTVALAPVFGVWGVMSGTILALSGGALYQIVLVHRHFGMPLRQYRDATRPSFLMALFLAVPVILVATLTPDVNRWVQAALCIGLATTYLGGYSYGALRLGVLPGTIARLLQRRPPAIVGVGR